MTISVSTVRRLFALTLLLCLMPWAQAQWSWKDQDGRRIFSDQPPPTSIPDKDILKRPGGVKASALPLPAADATPSAATPPSTATAPKISGKDPALEKKIKEEKAKEAAVKKAEEEKVTAAKNENCARAKRAKASFDSGSRIASTNSQGEREIMSDANRAAETQRLQEIINSDCG